MSLQTEALRATSERQVVAYQHPNGNWSASEIVNHPTPSGCERWMPTYSDKREWPTADIARKELATVLPK
jgi:hypothetical protein